MTLAIDKRTDEVIGQVTTIRTRPVFGGNLTANEAVAQPWKIVVLTKEGYRNVDAASVRLERTGD